MKKSEKYEDQYFRTDKCNQYMTNSYSYKEVETNKTIVAAWLPTKKKNLALNNFPAIQSVGKVNNIIQCRPGLSSDRDSRIYLCMCNSQKICLFKKDKVCRSQETFLILKSLTAWP